MSINPKSGYYDYTEMVYSCQGVFEKRMVFRLKELRKEKGLSQLAMAIRLNMNQNNISRYENMEREADYKTLVTFADFFDVSVDYLLGRTDKRKW